MPQGIAIDEKLRDMVWMERKIFRVLMEQLIKYDVNKILLQQSILLVDVLRDRVQVVEGFSTYPRHFCSQVPPPPGICIADIQLSVV